VAASMIIRNVHAICRAGERHIATFAIFRHRAERRRRARVALEKTLLFTIQQVGGSSEKKAPVSAIKLLSFLWIIAQKCEERPFHHVHHG
jgi:hypothetical protein